MKILAAIMLILSSNAFASSPKCLHIGSRSEGWSFPDGKFAFADCYEKVAYCGAIGTRSEGWYVANVKVQGLIGWTDCSDEDLTAPICVNIGTRSEGWQGSDGKLHFAQCANKAVVCSAVGSRSEGWYYGVANRRTSKLLGYTQCAN